MHEISPEQQPLEPDLVRAQRDIHWAEQPVSGFRLPDVMGHLPGPLKGYLDRIMTPGFAFRHVSPDKWDKLLTGRTADLITTMDTPPLKFSHRRFGEPNVALTHSAGAIMAGYVALGGAGRRLDGQRSMAVGAAAGSVGVAVDPAGQLPRPRDRRGGCCVGAF